MTLAQAQNKQAQIVQNFFTKSAQVIADARLSAEDLRGEESASSPANSINRWFNLELRELDFFHEALRPWRTATLDEPPPPLVVETYLNPSKLRPGQTIVLGNSRCSTNKEIVLERWVIEFVPSAAAGATADAAALAEPSTEDLPAVYKRAIISIRSLYTASRLLPTWQLRQKLSRQKLISVPLKLGIKIHNGSMPISSRGRIGLSKSIAEKRSILQQFHVQPIAMPIGSLHCSVTYRSDVRFGVEDIEKVMAQKFMELDSPQPGGSAAGTPSSVNSLGGFHPGSQTMGPRPILNFTRPFKTPDSGGGGGGASTGGAGAGAGAASAAGFLRSVNSVSSHPPQSVSGSASSVVSTNSRFSSSFASQRAHGLAPRSVSHEVASHRAASITSQNSHESTHNSLDPGSGMYMAQSDVGDFVKFVDETRKKGADRIRGSVDIDSALSRYQSMRSSYVQLSDSIMQSSQQPQETVKPNRRRGSGPRSRLGFYAEHEDDDRDQDLLFALSDMHT